eukprot:tig00000792_g4212.t1
MWRLFLCLAAASRLPRLTTDRDPLEYGLRLDRSFSHVVNAHELGKVPNAEWTNLRACYEAKNKMDDIDVRSGKPIGYVEEEERIDFLDFEGLCGAEEASSVEGGVAAAVAEEASFAEFADEAVEAGEYETL